MSDWKIAVGATAFGLVIGWLIHTFVRSSDEPSFKLFSGLSTVLAGAGAVAMLRGADGYADGFMYYFLGMIVALVVPYLLTVEPEDGDLPAAAFARRLGEVPAPTRFKPGRKRSPAL